jgi:hypothetical protein
MPCPSKWLCPPYGAAVVGTMTIRPDGKVSVTTDRLKSNKPLPQDLIVEISKELLTKFHDEKQTSGYGLMIVECRNPLKLISFFTFMNDAVEEAAPIKRLAVETALDHYTKLFEEFVELGPTEQARELEMLYGPYSPATAS